MTNCSRPVYKLHPTELPNDYQRNEYLSALNCAIGGLVLDRNQASTDRERASWSKEIAVLQKIVESIRQGEYRPTDESIDEGIDAEADRCSSHVDCSEGGAA